MAQKLTWLFELRDGMSSGVKKITGYLHEMHDATERTGESIARIAEGVGIERLAEKVLELGKEFATEVLHANKFATETKIAFETLTGSVEAGNEVFEKTRTFAINAGVPLESVANSYKALLLGGVAEDKILAIANASTSLAALGPKGVSMESWAQAFADIASRGELAGRSLMQFKGVLDFKELAAQLGHAGLGAKQLMHVLNESPVSADKGINAILLALQAKEGGVLGKTRAKIAETFSGTIQSIKEELLSLFEFEGAADSPILQFLHAVRDALRPDGPLVGQIKAGALAFLDGLGVITGPGGFDSLISQLKSGTLLGDEFKRTMHDIGTVVHVVAEGLGLVVKGIASLHGLLHKGGGYDELVKAGIAREATAAEVAAAKPTAGLTPHERFGDDTFKGFAHWLLGPGLAEGAGAQTIPQFASGGVVPGSGPQLAVVHGGETIIPAGQAGGTSLVVHQEFHVHGAGSLDVQELARELHAIGLGDLQGALDTLAQQMGQA